MMNRERLNTIGVLALPIVAGQISQNVINLVDTAMVGVLGPSALAAVGLAAFANFMAVAAVMGLSSGVQAMAARRKGEGRDSEMAAPLNGGLLFALAYCLPMSVTLFALTPDIFPYLNADPAVVEEGVPYLQARLVGMVAVGMNFAFRGYWNGVSLSRIYLRALLTMHAANVVLNYALIFGNFGFPALGTLGAGIGTAIATFLGTAYYAVQGYRLARGSGFCQTLPDDPTMTTILRLAIPSSVQQTLFAAGLTTLFWIIGQIGTHELAAASVLINLVLVAILPGVGLGLAAASLAGQALGRGDPEDAYRWGWDVVKVAAVVMGGVGLPMLIIPDIILAGFIHDQVALDLARLPLRLIGAAIIVDAVGTVFLNGLMGVGASRQTMIVGTVSLWCLFLPAAWLAGPVLGLGLIGVWTCFIAYRAIQAAILVVLWENRGWTRIPV